MTGAPFAFLRRLLRRTPAPAPARRASPMALAVLEHDVYGTEVQPGTAAALALGLRAFGNSGVSSREMMHRMNDCPATGTIHIGDDPITVICNLRPHEGDQHHDVVHGDWSSGS